MLDGIYSFEITFLGTEIKGIAMAENNNIRGFNWSHVYKVERSEKHGKTYWHVTENADSISPSGALPLLWRSGTTALWKW